MNINLLLFSSILNSAELYLHAESENNSESIKLDSKKNTTIDNEIEKAMSHVIDKGKIEFSNKRAKNEKDDDSLGNLMEYISKAEEIFEGVIPSVKKLYNTFISYAKSIYKGKKENKNKDKDCWQIGIDISRVANFIFFPKKAKKVTGQLIDKGILLDYINPSPALTYF